MYGPGGGPKMTRTLPVAALFLIVLLAALASVVLMPRGGAPDIYIPAPAHDWQASPPVQPAAPAAPVVDSAQAAVAVQAPVWASDPYLGYGESSFEIQNNDGAMIRVPDLGWIINQSVRHGEPMPEFGGRVGTESYEQMTALWAVSANGQLQQKGDGRSNGSVTLHLGKDLVDVGWGAVVIKVAKDNYIRFVVLQAPLEQNSSFSCLNGMLCFGDGSFVDPAKLIWSCAWWASGRAKNGHGTQPIEVRIQMGYGHDQWWSRVQTRYNPLVPIAAVPLPPIILDRIK